MALADLCNLLMVLTLLAALLAGFPVGLTLAGVATIWAGIGIALGVFDAALLGALPSRIFGGAMTNEVLTAVPVFIFMGMMLERSRVAEELLDTMGKLFGTLRGGLGYSVAIVGALMAASTGIIGATVVTMGLLSLPTMLRRGYDTALSAGTISAAGTLGQLIPPSIVLVLLGSQISNAYVEAQRAVGNWSPEPVSVGDLFAGALLPGLMLVGLYIAYVAVVAWRRPDAAPAIPRETDEHGWAMARRAMRALVPPVVLIVAVLGSILAGVATPTEAASVGAAGATLLAAARLAHLQRESSTARAAGSSRWPAVAAAVAVPVLLVLTALFDLRVKRESIPATDWAAIAVAAVAAAALVAGLLVAIWRTWRAGVLTPVVHSTVRVTAMVFVIFIGASVFSLVFRGLGGEEVVRALLTGLPGGIGASVAIVMAVMFVLGFFLDFIEIIFVVVPLVAPVLLESQISPVWLGVLMAMNLQTSFLTPPFGFALFYLRGVAPAEISTRAIYIGAVPFVAIQLVGLSVLAAFPGLATWLPNVLFD